MADADYLTWARLTALIPETFAIEGLDDGDGHEANWEEVRSAACDFVDSFLAPRYATPVASPNALIREGALYKAIDLIYGRRGMEEQNPFADDLERVSEQLQAIGDGDAPLAPTASKTNSPAVAITQPSRTHSERINL